MTYGEPCAMEALIQHCNQYLRNWIEFDALQKEHVNNPKDESIPQRTLNQRFAVENFVLVSENKFVWGEIEGYCTGEGNIGVSIHHLRERCVIVGRLGYKSTHEVDSRVASVPLILSMLRGLSMGHLPTQNHIDVGGILPLLHALEIVAGENEIGAMAENLLDTLSDKEGSGNRFLREKILKL